ncbi:MAG: HEPN domain-containing protein [Proteiniphilum sp.]|uniref:HEPN domain-containing protein n=1 Tax=Proteiniphilum sp. TaxID=1926877 RepID=UPI002AB91BE8|nr:HEPN domain-containing protein [Proteiniphilum sp.]MDY9919432.1 HEPN domain-containing protein [Proteiniphilum sp.]
MKGEMTEEMIDALAMYRLQRAKDTVQEAIDMLEKEHYNAAINRLYYASYYAVSALLVKNGIQVHTHSGTKQMFGMHFIVNGKLPRSYNITYNELFDKRHSGDYDDFLFFDRETVERLIPETEAFIQAIQQLIEQ